MNRSSAEFQEEADHWLLQHYQRHDSTIGPRRHRLGNVLSVSSFVRDSPLPSHLRSRKTGNNEPHAIERKPGRSFHQFRHRIVRRIETAQAWWWNLTLRLRKKQRGLEPDKCTGSLVNRLRHARIEACDLTRHPIIRISKSKFPERPLKRMSIYASLQRSKSGASAAEIGDVQHH